MARMLSALELSALKLGTSLSILQTLGFGPSHDVVESPSPVIMRAAIRSTG